MAESIDIKNFKTGVLEKSKTIPVLVDFWAPWCEPCRILAPILEEIASENHGEFILAKLNTEDYPAVAKQYDIKSIPAVKLFINGKVEMEFNGALPKTNILRLLKKFLPSGYKMELEDLKKNIATISETDLIARLKNLVEKDAELTEAKILLAKTVVFTQPDLNTTAFIAHYGGFRLFTTRQLLLKPLPN